MKNIPVRWPSHRLGVALCESSPSCPVDVCTHCPLNSESQMEEFLKDNEIEIVFKPKGEEDAST